MEVGGIRLDPNNYEFMQALAIAQATNNNLYLTGKAGSGKTFFLKYLKKVCKIPIKSVSLYVGQAQRLSNNGLFARYILLKGLGFILE